ncbi:MAG TPA: hypothetical protein GX717_06820 [Clostridiaceae bacterium]|nr:hypothetical protein [Clostridiaceae bacterium]
MDNVDNRKYTSKAIWFVYGLLVIVAWLAAGSFLDRWVEKIFLTGIAFPFFLNLWQRYSKHKNRAQKRREFLTLLQCLAGELSTGGTYHIALMNTQHTLKQQLDPNNKIAIALAKSIAELKRRSPLSAVLINLGQRIQLPEARSLFNLIAQNLELGNQTVHIVRDARDMQAKQLEIEAEARTEQTATITESLLLMAIPFVMARIFKKMFNDTSDLAGAGQPLITRVVLIASFLIACLALLIGGKMLFPADAVDQFKRKRTTGENKYLERIKYTLPIRALAKQLTPLLPTPYLTEWNKQLLLLGNNNGDYQNDLLLRLTIIILGESIAWITVISGHLSWWIPIILPPIIWFAADYQLKQQVKQREYAVNAAMPLFLETLLQFLRVGETPVVALKRSLNTQNETPSILHATVKEIMIKVENGANFNRELYTLARQFQTVQIQSVFILIAQYNQTGHKDTLASLTVQKEACWQLYKKAIQERGKTLAARLILPMSMDLLAVILIALTPAINVFITF